MRLSGSPRTRRSRRRGRGREASGRGGARHVEQGRELLVAPAAGALARWDVRVEATPSNRRLGPWLRWTASEFGIGEADPMLRVEAVQRGRRRRSARRKQARKRRVPRPSSGRRTSPRGSRRRRAVCRAPQRARRGSQGRARREPPTRRGRAEACGDRPLPSTWVDDASRCSAGQRAIASSADVDARGQHDMPLRSRVDG